MDQYKNNPKAQSIGTVFPVLSNQRMNGYLKDMDRLKERLSGNEADNLAIAKFRAMESTATN